MKRFKRNSWILAGLVLVLFSGAPVWGGEVKIALDCPPDLQKCGTYIWSHYFSEHLKVNGFNVKLYPRDALGGEEEKLDQVCQGLLEVTGGSDLSKAGQLEPFIFGFYLPYLFKDMSHVDRVIERSDLIAKVNSGLTKRGVRLLSIVSVGGFAGIINTKKPVSRPADMKGLRMRAMDKKQAMWLEAWGANSVIIPWPEIYNSLQTGVADGYLNAAIVPVMFKHTEVVKYFTDAKIIAPFRVTLCSEDWFQGLKENERSVVLKAAAIANKANRVWQAKIDAIGLTAIQKAGVKVTVPTESERAEFAGLIRPIYSKLVPPETASAFIAAADEYR